MTGTDLDCFFLGSAPCAHLEHVYPKEYQEKNDVYGTKVCDADSGCSGGEELEDAEHPY